MSGLGEPSGGRPPILYRTTANAGFYIGVDLSRTHVTILLLDANFGLLSGMTFNMDTSYTPKKALLEMIKHIVGIGIGAVGPIDEITC